MLDYSNSNIFNLAALSFLVGIAFCSKMTFFKNPFDTLDILF